MKYLSWLGVVVLILMGIYVRFSGLHSWYFSPDDVWHLLIARGENLSDVVERNSMDTHPIMMYVVLHYMQLVSNNELFLRLFSLIPGILFIPSVYVLGRKFYGVASGYFLAFFASLGVSTVLLSQVIRQYSISLLMLCWSMFFWKDMWDGKFKKKFILLFSLFSFFSVGFHYVSAIVVLTLVFLLIFKFVFFERKLKKVALIILFSVLPMFIFLMWSYKVQKAGISLQTKRASEYWLQNSYPDSIYKFVESYILILDYYSFLNIAWVLLVVISLTFFLNTKIKGFSMGLWIFLIPLFVNMLTSYLKIYPFIYTRHSQHLWLSILLPLSGMFNQSYQFIKSKIPKKFVSYRSLIFLEVMFFLVILQSGLKYIEDRNFYRSGTLTSEMEFPISKHMIKTMYEYLNSEQYKSDYLVVDNDTADYISYWSGYASNGYMKYIHQDIKWLDRYIVYKADSNRLPKLYDYEEIYQSQRGLHANTIYLSLGWLSKDGQNLRTFITDKSDIVNKKYFLLNTSGLVIGYQGVIEN